MAGALVIAGASALAIASTEPAPAKMSVKVPTNSAKPRRSGSWSIAEGSYAAGRTAWLRGSDGVVGAARPNRLERGVELPEDREGRAEPGQVQDLMDLGVVADRKEEGEAEQTIVSARWCAPRRTLKVVESMNEVSRRSTTIRWPSSSRTVSSFSSRSEEYASCSPTRATTAAGGSRLARVTEIGAILFK